MTMTIRVIGIENIEDLADDLRAMPVKEAREMTGVVREGARVGVSLAKDNARRTQGKHAKLYARTFSASTKRAFFGFGAAVYSAEYGPEAHGQGLLAPILERGTRNNPPHLDLAKSADVIGPALVREVRDALDRMFW